MTGVPILVPGVEKLPLGLVRCSALVVVGVPTGYTGEAMVCSNQPRWGFLALVIVMQVWTSAVVWEEKGCL